jgi:ATP-dependent RNA helicase DeaD
MTFNELGIAPNILSAVKKMGFEKPTPIQELTIPALLTEDTDMIALAQTGTGKTAAFGLPLLSKIDFSDPNTQGLVIAPTRELCNQITNDLKNFAIDIPHSKIVAVYGGASITAQIKDIKSKCHIIVATPGRLKDLIGRGVIKLHTVNFVVLDEADEMLNMGFRDDIEEILSKTPETKNVWLFSATMPKEIRIIASKYMRQPLELGVGKVNTTNENITHACYITKAKDKYQTLRRIVDYFPDIFGIIFVRTKIETQEIAEKLIRDGYNADALHGDLSQPQRDTVMHRFRTKHLQILVATDVAARGIDVHDLTHIIHYSLPDDNEVYTHRSGRTARAGKTGQSLAILHGREVGKLRGVEQECKLKFEKRIIPSGEDVCEKQLFHIIEEIHNIEVNETAIAPYMERINKELASLTKEEIVMRLASVEFNRFLHFYKNAPDLNIDANSSSSRSEGRGDSRSSGQGGMLEVFVSVGEKDGINRGNFLKFLRQMGLNDLTVGRFEVNRLASYFDVNAEDCNAVIEALHGEEWQGRKLRCNQGEGKRNPGGRPGGGGERRSWGGDSKPRFNDRNKSDRKGGPDKGGNKKRDRRR